MKKAFPLLLVILGLGALPMQAQQLPPKKLGIIRSVEAHEQALVDLSDKIWGYAETAMKEHRSAKVLADYAEAQGFQVERGVAEMPTAFVATYGSGRPIIGILGEYDALPGISQKASPLKEPLEAGAAGHGCGHNLFGAGSLGAAIAIKELMEAGQLKGTIRFYGTPAEESVGGKLYMARAGLFDDLDACLDWHPSDEILASTQSSQAVIDYSVTFKGKAAHAAYDPWNGRSALDGLEAFLHGINLYREHVRPSVRIHYTIVRGGDVPNVVPEYAEVWLWARDSRMSGVEEIAARIRQIAEGAALIAGLEQEVRLNNGIYEILPNRKGASILQANLELLGPISYTEEEQAFAHQIQETTGKKKVGMDTEIRPLEETKADPEGGSTDVGDVSWIVPEISLAVTTAPKDTPWHAWPVVACGGMSIGHKGMLYAAKALAMTMADLYEQPNLLEEMKAEFRERKGDKAYKAMIPDGPPPLPPGSR